MWQAFCEVRSGEAETAVKGPWICWLFAACSICIYLSIYCSVQSIVQMLFFIRIISCFKLEKSCISPLTNTSEQLYAVVVISAWVSHVKHEKSMEVKIVSVTLYSPLRWHWTDRIRVQVWFSLNYLCVRIIAEQCCHSARVPSAGNVCSGNHSRGSNMESRAWGSSKCWET